MRYYNPLLKERARELRKNLTDAEQRIWYRVRRKQIHGVQFYRQRPINNYIVDFYAPSVSLVVEIDGGQHFEEDQAARDSQRTLSLEADGLIVVRFDNLQVLQQLDEVVGEIERIVRERANPP